MYNQILSIYIGQLTIGGDMDNQLQTNILPSVQEFELLQRMLKPFLDSGFLPNTVKTPAQALTIAIKGRDLGIPPLQAFSHINVIQGKPTISAELMLALIFRKYPTANITYKQNDSKACIIEAARPGGTASTFSFSMDDADKAGLSGNNSWKKYPADLLKARCISRMSRSLFPECLMGCSYTPEELGGPIDNKENLTVASNEDTSDITEVQGASKAPVDTPTNSKAEGVEETQLSTPFDDQDIKTISEFE